MKRLLIPFLILMCLYMLSSRMGMDGYELEYLLSAENLIYNGSLSMSPLPSNLPGIHERIPGQLILPRHNLLQVFITVPFYVVGIPFNSLHERTDSGILALPPGSIAAVSFLNSLFTLFAIGLLIRICRQLGSSDQAAILCGLTYGIATMAWPYAAIGMEPLQTACFLLSLSAFIHFSRQNSLLSTLALAMSITALMHTKISAPLLAIPLAIAGLVILCKTKSKRSRKLLLFVGILGCASIIWFILYYIRSQSFYSYNFFQNLNLNLLPRNIVGLLISPGKSLLLYSPILLWCLPGIPDFIRNNRSLSILVGTIAILILLVTACWDWSLIEECWGPRYLMPVIPMIIFAGSRQFELQVLRKRKYLFISLVIISILVQIPGVLYPNVCLMQYVYSNSVPIIDLSTWIPDLSPIRIGWHMIANKFRETFDKSMQPFKWHHYRGVVGWGSHSEIAQFSDHHWNRPYTAPFLIARYIQVTPEGIGLEYPDPDWMFIVWISVTIALCVSLAIWFLLLLRKSVGSKNTRPFLAEQSCSQHQAEHHQ